MKNTKQQESLDFYEQQVIKQYIAPQRNKHIFSVLPHTKEGQIYFPPTYNYTDYHKLTYTQIVVIHDGGECKIEWHELDLK